MKLVHWYREGRVFLFPQFGQNINKSNFKEGGGQREGHGRERGGEKRGGAGRGGVERERRITPSSFSFSSVKVIPCYPV